jgi:hypothetical protein
VTREVVELKAALKVRIELKATLKARVELSDTRLDATKLDTREDNNSTLVGVSVVKLVKLEGAVIEAELNAAIEVIKVVVTLVRVNKGVVITGVIVVKTTVSKVYAIYVEVA